VLGRTRLAGTATGAQAASTLRDYAKRAQAAMRAQRETGFKTAHLLTQNFATLASGILIGMSQGLGGKAAAPRKTGGARGRKAATTTHLKSGTAGTRSTAKSAKKTARPRTKARTAKGTTMSKRTRSTAGRKS